MTEAINPDAIPAISPLFRLQWEEVQQSYVILYPEGMVTLSPSAAEIMKCADGKTAVVAIISTLEQQFQQSDLSDDVINFLQEAHKNGWIQFN
jgi:pyrroloquinoline quinone biosynthesis protein D